MKLVKGLAVFAASAFALTACTTTEKVAVQQPSDMKLDCAGLEGEFNTLDGVMAEAKGNKGANGANIAAAVFFWPAAVGNYVNASQAEDLVKERRAHLMGIYEEKGC